MFAAEWRWQGVWNSFPFLAWDPSMHRRTQIWFFNQFICTGACACSPNLNCAHKMLRNQLMYKKGQTTPKNSFPFLAWDLRMHWRTQIWFFNQFICTGACACSLILNCAREMARKPVYCIKCPNEPSIIPILLRHTYSCMFTADKRSSNSNNIHCRCDPIL